MADIAEIKELAKALNLMNVYNGIIDISDEKVSNLDYLYNILKQEVDIRKENKITKLLAESRLPKKIFDDPIISQGLKWQLKEIEKIDFKNIKQNIVIVGEVATGKTSLATYITRTAIQKGAKAIYFAEEDFIEAYKIRKTMRSKILHSDLIVLDELFYLTPSDENLVYLYKTIMVLAETRSFIFVTNRPLSEWENMDVDKHIVTTFRQRIMTDAQLIHLG